MKYIVLLALIIILLPGITTLAVRKTTGINQTNEIKLAHFYGDKNFTESFVSPKDRLNSLVIKLKNTSIRNNQQVEFRLLDGTQVIRSIKLNGSNIGDGEFVRFAFEPVFNSKNKLYTFELQSPASTPSDAIAVQVNEKDQAALITYHAVDSRWRLVESVYAELFSKILKDPMFLILWVSVFALLNLLIFSNFSFGPKCS